VSPKKVMEPYDISPDIVSPGWQDTYDYKSWIRGTSVWFSNVVFPCFQKAAKHKLFLVSLPIIVRSLYLRIYLEGPDNIPKEVRMLQRAIPTVSVECGGLRLVITNKKYKILVPGIFSLV
jgi:hypothetical protein